MNKHQACKIGRFKKKFRHKGSDEVIASSSDGSKEDNEKDWFTNQYETLIGKPLAREEVSMDEVLRDLQESTKYRWVPEANNYKILTPQYGTVHYIEWRNPKVQVCNCPDGDCTCTGNPVLPRKKIPRGERHVKSTLCRKLARLFKKPPPPPTESFAQKLAAAVGVEAAVYQDLENNAVLNIRGADFCISRCIRCYEPDFVPSPNICLEKPMNQNDEYRPSSLKNKDNDDGDRTCEEICTVSTQSTVGPNGEIVIGGFSHELYSTPDEAIVKDIEGRPLQIISYRCTNEETENKSNNFCDFEKLMSMRKLINMTELKKQISLLTQTIYSSIIEEKEKSSSADNIAIQCEEGDNVKNDDSSEDITIPTPYKGVVLKAKKKPQNREEAVLHSETSHPSKCSPVETDTDCGKVHEQLKIEASKTNVVTDVPKKVDSNKITTVKSVGWSNVDIQKTESYENIQIQKQNISEKCKTTFPNSSINMVQDPQTKIFPAKSKELSQKNIQESSIAENSTDNTINVKQIKDDIIQKQGDDGSKLNMNIPQVTSKTPEIKMPTEQTNNFIKSIIKDLSGLIHGNKGNTDQKELQLEGSKSIVRNVQQKIEDCYMGDPSKIKSQQETSYLEEFKVNSALPDLKLHSNFKTKSHPVVTSVIINNGNKQMISVQNINPSSTENQVTCQQEPEDLSCTLKEKYSDTHVHKIVTSVDKNITETHICVKEALDSRKPSLINFAVKIDCDPKYNNDKLIRITNCNERLQHHENKIIPENIPLNSNDIEEVVITLENAIKNGANKYSILTKISHLSSALKKLLLEKIRKSVKSWPEPTIRRSFRKWYRDQESTIEIERKTYIKCGKKKEEPKTSEKEMFSIQYSAISEMKCSSKFLKIEQFRSYPGVQEVHDCRSPDQSELRRLTS